jgi:hypothetical protein
MGRRWLAMLLVLAPVAGRAQTFGDTAAALATQGQLAGTSAGSASSVLDGVRRSLAQSGQASQNAGGWGEARGTKSGWATAGSMGSHGNSAAGGCWASNNSQHSSRGWATADKQSAAGSGWAKAGDRPGATIRR